MSDIAISKLSKSESYLMETALVISKLSKSESYLMETALVRHTRQNRWTNLSLR